MASNKCRLSRRARAGAVVVELALTLPLFLMMGMGCLELGRALMVQQMLVNAAREGSRHGIMAGATKAAVVTKVGAYLATGKITPTAVQVKYLPANSNTWLDLSSTAKSGEPVKVSIQVSYSAVTWIPSPWFLRNASLGSETVMRRE